VASCLGWRTVRSVMFSAVSGFALLPVERPRCHRGDGRIKVVGGQVVAIMRTQASPEFPTDSVRHSVRPTRQGLGPVAQLAIWARSRIQKLLSVQDLARLSRNAGWVLADPATLVSAATGG